MTADDNLRDEIAAALDDTATGLWMFGQHGPGWGYKVADALLPVVERLQRQAAAAELRSRAEELGFGKDDVQRRRVADWLESCAAALDPS